MTRFSCLLLFVVGWLLFGVGVDLESAAVICTGIGCVFGSIWWAVWELEL